MGETMRNIIIFVALLGAAAIFTVLYCLIAAGSQAEKKLTEIMRKEEEQNEDGQYNIRCMEHVFHTDSHHMVSFLLLFSFPKADSGTVSSYSLSFYLPTSNSTCRTMAFLRCTFFPQ